MDDSRIKHKGEDEIDLIDLFIVLLKWRRLIVGLPLLTALILGIILFALPALGLYSFQTYNLQAMVASVQIPPALKDQIGMDIPGLTASYAQEFKTVMDTIIRTNLKTDGLPHDPQNLEFRTFVLKGFIEKQYKVTAQKEGGVRLEIKSKDREGGKQFLEEMVKQVDLHLRKEIADRSRVVHQSMEQLYNEAGPQSILSDTVKQLITASRTYSTGDMPILVTITEPEVFLEAQGRSTIVIVGVVAVFFLSIFLAFILEYVHNVRKNPETMARIRAALGKEK
jgi:hypothetical protein